MEEEREQNTKERVMFQYIMSYKAYRRFMIATRVAATVVCAGGLACLSLYKVPLGIIFGVMALFLGAIAVIVALGREETYIVFDTRFVIKHADKRASVPLENIKSVKYKRAFYEKNLATGTVTVTAVSPDNGKIKKYRLRHVFDAKAGVKFLADAARANAERERAKENDGVENIG